MQRKKKLFLNSGTSIIYEIVAVVCGFILPRIYLSTYGSGVNGLISSISQFLSIFSFLQLGMGSVTQSALYKPLANGDTLQLSKIYISAKQFYATIAKILIAYILVLVFVYPFGVIDSFPYWYTAILILAISISSFAQYYIGKVNHIVLEADQRLYIPNTLNIIATIVGTALSAILMLNGSSIQLVKFIASCTYLIRPLGMLIYVKKNYVLKKDVVIEKGDEPIPQKWNGIAQSVASSVLSNTDVVILTLFSTLENVSVYSIYYMVVSGIRQAITAVTTGFKSMLGNMMARNETNLLQNTFDKFEWFMHTASTLLFTITAILIVPFVTVYTNNITDADYIAPVFSILITMAIAVNCIRLPYNTAVLAAGHFKQTQASCFIEVAINVLLSIILVWRYGLVGVAIGTLAAMLYRTIYLAVYLSKNILSRSISHFIKHVIIDVLSVIIMAVSTFWISLAEVSYLAWIIMAVKVSVICGIICIAINVLFFRRTIVGIVSELFSRLRK